MLGRMFIRIRLKMLSASVSGPTSSKTAAIGKMRHRRVAFDLADVALPPRLADNVAIPRPEDDGEVRDAAGIG